MDTDWNPKFDARGGETVWLLENEEISTGVIFDIKVSRGLLIMSATKQSKCTYINFIGGKHLYAWNDNEFRDDKTDNIVRLFKCYKDAENFYKLGKL